MPGIENEITFQEDVKATSLAIAQFQEDELKQLLLTFSTPFASAACLIE
jgi:hypothetical protein